MVERLIPNQGVGGSNPSRPASTFKLFINNRFDVKGMDFRIKKKEQASNTRLGAGVLLLLVGISFVYAVYGWFIDKSFFDISYAGIDFKWGHVLGAVTGIMFIGITLWLLLFKEASVDFLVRVDREIKKVTWPSGVELKNSVFVIVGVIAFFGIIVYIYDLIFAWGIWQKLLGLTLK